MKIYRVKVNGKIYEVEVEAVDEVERKTESAPVKEEVKVKSEEGEKQMVAYEVSISSLREVLEDE